MLNELARGHPDASRDPDEGHQRGYPVTPLQVGDEGRVKAGRLGQGLLRHATIDPDGPNTLAERVGDRQVSVSIPGGHNPASHRGRALGSIAY